MRVTGSAGAQNMTTGIRAQRSERLRLGQRLDIGLHGLGAEIERGWRFFWRQRGIEPPPVSKTLPGLFAGDVACDRRIAP